MDKFDKIILGIVISILILVIVLVVSNSIYRHHIDEDKLETYCKSIGYDGVDYVTDYWNFQCFKLEGNVKKFTGKKLSIRYTSRIFSD